VISSGPIICPAIRATLPITELALASRCPSQFIRTAFSFSPVEKMPVVEVIMGRASSERRSLARLIRRINLANDADRRSNDSRAFYTSRCFSTCHPRAMALLEEARPPGP